MIRIPRLPTAALLLLSLGCRDTNANAQADDVRQRQKKSQSASSTAGESLIRPPISHVPTPDTLRGLYVNRWAALGSKLKGLIRVARKTEINALVIDVKDDRGF